MSREELKNNLVVLHIKHNRTYKIICCNARLKDASGQWKDAVIYVPRYVNNYEMFARELESFLAEFEVIYN